MTVRLPYEAPTFERLPFLAYGKYAPRDVLKSADADQIPFAKQLVAKYGSPLYVVSEARLRSDFNRFRDVFTLPGLVTSVAYSVKTNYLPAVCSIMKQEGALAEVVSAMEYELARELGYEGRDIIFNGPHKERNILERAVGEGAIVNIDGFDELARVSQIASSLNTAARIGLRLSFRYNGTGWTKFGFDDDQGETDHALQKIAQTPNLALELLHNHCGTFVLNHALYSQSISRLIDTAKRARSLGLAPTTVDVGGGFPSVNHLKPEYDFPGGSERKGDFWRTYSEEICAPILRSRELFGGNPRLILEPGRAVVDASTQLLTTVVAKKEPSGGTPSIIVDAGVNLVPTSVYYDHPISRVAPDRPTAGRSKEYDVYGPLCMQTDILRRAVAADDFEVGDILSVSHVGAYCHSQSVQFIETRPATILMGSDGPTLIRRRESWRDVFALDVVPAHLRDDACNF